MNKDLDQFSGFNKVKLSLTKPKMSFDIEYKNLALICGTNGVGKSFSNKLTWLNIFTMNLFIVEETHGVKLNEDFTREETLQFVLDTTFEEQDFCGKVKYYYEDDLVGVPHYILEYTLEDGKVTELFVEYPTEAKASNAPTYLSKETRQFSYLDRYITMKGLLQANFETFPDLQKLCEHFRIYDIFASEQLLQKLPYVSAILASIANTSDMLEGLDIDSIQYNETKKGICYTDSSGVEKRITTLGDGHQALLIMMIGAVPVPEEVA